MAYQQYPPQGGHPYPGMAPKPSGATGIIAGILAIIGGLWFLSGFVFHVIYITDGNTMLYFLLGAVLDFLVGILLLIGGILLVMRKGAGRVLTVVGAASAILIGLLSVVLRLVGTHFFLSFGGVSFLYGFVGLIVQILLPAIATMVLALIPPTARWVAKRPVVLMPPQNFGYPPGQPPSGYPQAPGPPPARW
jgi:hypothetical protein